MPKHAHMRIAQVTPVYPPYRGGMARVPFEYTERLRARGHDVHVFSPQSGKTVLHPPHELNYVHHVPAQLRVGNAALLPSLPSELAGFDVVHLHYPFYGGAEPVAHARASGDIRTLVLTYHMDASADGVKGAVFDLHREAVQPWIVSQADAILVSSLDYANVSALARVDRALERVKVLPFGVDVDRFHPGAEPALRATLGIDNGIPVILFVGGLDAAHRFKGLAVLFTSLTTLARERWHLIVVGAGKDRAAFEQESTGVGLKSRVTFAGDVDDDELPSFYRIADVHVLPSTNCAEAFGLVTLEAAASGVPSIVSNLPGVRTTVAHGTTGLAVTPGDPASLGAALRQLLASSDLRSRLGREARQNVEREYRWEPLMDRLEAAYRTVLGRA